MNYTELKAAALSYSDRSDTETSDMIDTFMPVVEGRMNRALKLIGLSGLEQYFILTPNVDTYALPDDFGGVKDLRLQTDDNAFTQYHYATPQFMTGLLGVTTSRHYYTIIGGKLKVYPAPPHDTIVEMTHHKKISALSSVAPDGSNWVSENFPDCYIFGLLVEISSFAKDAAAKTLWDGRFKESIEEIRIEDGTNRWSGVPLETRVG